MEGILLRTAANGHASIHPCVEVLVRRGGSIVIVACIRRLYPRVRLRRKWSDHVGECIVGQPGCTIIGGPACPHPVARRARAGWLAASSGPFALVIPHSKEAACRVDRYVRLPLGLGRIGIAVKLERRAESHAAISGANVEHVTRVPSGGVASSVDIVNDSVESSRLSPTFMSPISRARVHGGERARSATARA